MTSCVGSIRALNLPRKDKAFGMLKEVCVEVEPIMRSRGWKVGEVAESNFKSANILGMNVNYGQKILLRLRRNHQDDVFLEQDSVIDTMLHELCHIVHGAHSDEFYALWDKLRSEYESNRAKGIRGSGAGFDAKGHKLDSGAHNPQSMLDARRMAAQAAEKRGRLAEVMGNSAERLGGEKKNWDAATAARIAALKRCGEWCGEREDEIIEEEEEEEVVKKTEEEKGEGERDNKKRKNDDDDDHHHHHHDLMSWSCCRCTFVNSSDDKICTMCDTPREGLWSCPACTFVNNSLFHCLECGLTRTIGQ